jgi:broad specificity phosphatase PhoE
VKILFARHGESQANLLRQISNRGLAHPLTSRGRRQAASLAERLQGRPLVRLYTSPLLRAIETTALLADRLGLEYEVTEALREFDCGVMEGRADEAAWQAWRQVVRAWSVGRLWDEHIPGGESYNDLRARFVPFIEGLVQQYGGGQAEVLCLGHGGLYCLLLPQVLVNIDFDFFAGRGFGNSACLLAELRPQGLTCLEFDGEKVA